MEGLFQIADREAVVVYSKHPETGAVERRISHGPEDFMAQPGEWLHTFSWHGSRAGPDGSYQKVPNALVFQKLWLLPDQMYHDVPEVRTADGAVLTVRLMLFFELQDIDKAAQAVCSRSRQLPQPNSLNRCLVLSYWRKP